MASWWRDEDFQKSLLSFIVRDLNFLKKCGTLLTPKDFKPARDETRERYIVAYLALEFWKKYKAPIGGMLRSSCAKYCLEHSIDGKEKRGLDKLIDNIQNGERLVAVEAMEERVVEYIKDKKLKDAIEEIITKKEEGQLDQDEFISICKKAVEWSGNAKHIISSYLDESQLEHRIARRSLSTKKKRPLLFLPGFDSKSPAIGRGDLGLVLGNYKKGKSLALAHLADSYAKQKLNVLYFTLEDPKDEVEDRMDAALAYMPIGRLDQLPNKLRKRWKKFAKNVAGHIKIVDGTEEHLTVDDMEQIWENERDQGFIADVVIIDYDDEIKPTKSHKGDASRRMEFADIYRALRRFAAKKSVIMWTAAQTKRIPDSTKIVTGDKASEDISKIRKSTIVLGIGQGEAHKDARYVYVAAFKRGPSHFGFEIMSSPAKGLFYDEDLTNELIKNKKVVPIDEKKKKKLRRAA